MTKITGTPETRNFYDQTGWKEQDGASVDHNLFGVTEDGPIRVELHQRHSDRIRSMLSQAGTGLNLLECGCGGNPERQLLDLCSRYTGVDFSATGLEMARASFASVDIPYDFQIADVCALPFEDREFDAVYCAHIIYHIQDPAGQDAAIAELMRVVRPGGVVVLVAANPHPFLFPLRFARRVAADTPLLNAIFNRFRAKPPLPYQPMSIGWTRRRFARGGHVEVLGGGIPSTSFNRNVTEFKGLGKLAWTSIRWLDLNYPKLSAYLGNYVMYSYRKADADTRVQRASA